MHLTNVPEAALPKYYANGDKVSISFSVIVEIFSNLSAFNGAHHGKVMSGEFFLLWSKV